MVFAGSYKLRYFSKYANVLHRPFSIFDVTLFSFIKMCEVPVTRLLDIAFLFIKILRHSLGRLMIVLKTYEIGKENGNEK